MAIGTALAAGIGAAGSIGGAAISGAAAGKRQNQALGVSQQNRQEALGFAEGTEQEIALLERAAEQAELAFSQQQANVARQERLVNAIDPTLAEAGRQAFQLLQGQQSKAGMERRRRAEQRLQDRLREQLGSGAETSTFGAQAFGELEAQQSGLDQQELAQLLGVSLQARPDLGAEIGRLGQIGQLGLGAAQGFGNIQQRQVTAALGSPVQAPSGPTTAGLIGGSLSTIGSTLLGGAIRKEFPEVKTEKKDG